ncbi:aldo/keto reductase [Mycena floridula]|nr:aldo/keto reductase [Mycena floridula]
MFHVNTMDDVLISQLPPNLLRSALRVLVGQGSFAQQAFVQHVQRRLQEGSSPFPPEAKLFSEAAAFLAHTRCLFASKLVQESISQLNYFVKSIPQAELNWQNDVTLDNLLTMCDGDIVQAIQAVKESQPTPSTALKSLIMDLQTSLTECSSYCCSKSLTFPFTRAQLQVDDVLVLLSPNVHHYQVAIAPDIEAAVIDPEISAKIEHVQLGPLSVPRLFNGLWQMSSPAWGSSSSIKQHESLLSLVRVGLVATDMADHYGDAELVYGSFRNRLPGRLGEEVIAATKWCVFRPLDEPVTKELVLKAVQERSRRLGGRVDLLQFHWYDYSVKDYLIVLAELIAITKSHPHLVSSIGLCNFDAETTQEACEYLLATTGTVGIVSNQVQYSLIDSRPQFKMADICHRYGLKILTYGSFCGGFLSEKWLNRDAPDLYSEAIPLTPSQRKYFDIIINWGSWEDMQTLLLTLKVIADEHHVEISNVAARWVLDQPEVGAVIVGTRLGLSNNSDSNLKVFTFALTDEDRRRLDNVIGNKGRALFDKMGDCGHEYSH